MRLEQRWHWYVISQQYCQCNTPTCCPTGWRLTFAGFRFITPSENPPKPSQSSISSITELGTSPPSESLLEAEKGEVAIDMVCAASLATINYTSLETPPSNKLITMESLNNASKPDPEYEQLIKTILAGFPKTKHLTLPNNQQYWEVRQCLSVEGDVVLLVQCLVIPKKLRNAVLHNLHSAHQGTTTMQFRASKTFYWPGINNHIKNMRDTSHSCSYNVPSHSKEPHSDTTP